MNKHLVVALAYDRLCTFEFGCVVELFALERPELGVDWYDFKVCAVEPGPIRAAGGITLQAPYEPGLLALADTIVIPGWRDADEPPPPALLEAIRAAHARGARLCSICSGVFVLAAAGVLDHKRATTHWRYTERLARRHPRVIVRPDDLYVDEGQVITSAGSAAGIDMLLHLVRRDHGARVGNLVAQRLVVAPHREGGQAQFLPRPMAPGERGRLSGLMEWLRAHPAEAHTVKSMAGRAAMSPRTLQRRFQEATGMGPVEWLTRERVALVKDLLETADIPLAQVAQRAGFGSEESLRHHFRRLAATSPGAYRRRFSGPA
ncbi:transcriptional regulator FtrA [Pseudoduganella namucuonensis]|uniref:Transcriptional regulator, AraC family /transcriptional regulator, AraC family with amidase-like domain n=1 Tax=Pseudoduganella namucuonensis TaxID=1035707 RepID=A0A1I7G9R5_9BURK|nr:transcriptional regulator FtrA [Pseudoduganella namucuonensis]SFU45210.1 transcriptional regulator, AraC family /transcriptional regulator, AraC family with amidase-like domain [Pseudoduganella namucuonensis]